MTASLAASLTSAWRLMALSVCILRGPVRLRANPTSLENEHETPRDTRGDDVVLYFANEAPTVVFGPGVLADEQGAVAHSDHEYVEVRAVRRAAPLLKEVLARFTG